MTFKRLQVDVLTLSLFGFSAAAFKKVDFGLGFVDRFQIKNK